MTDRRQRIEQIIQDDADEARAMGYESTAQAHEQRLDDYRASKEKDDREQRGQ